MSSPLRSVPLPRLATAPIPDPPYDDEHTPENGQLPAHCSRPALCALPLTNPTPPPATMPEPSTRPITELSAHPTGKPSTHPTSEPSALPTCVPGSLLPLPSRTALPQAPTWIHEPPSQSVHANDSSPQKAMAKAPSAVRPGTPPPAISSAVRPGTALSAVPSAENAGDPLSQESAECTDDAPPPVGLAARTYGSLALVSDRAVRRALVWGPPGAIPDERRLRHLGQAMAEVLAGRRPPKSVSDRLTERAYQELVRAGRMIDTRRPPFVGVPHVTQPNDAVVEMCLLVHCGERSHVLALRLERRGVQWLCTDFETA